MTAASAFYDALETRPAELRERHLMKALARQVAQARERTGAYAELLAGVAPGDVVSRAALARLPVTRKHELLLRQHAARYMEDIARRSADAAFF